MVEVSDAESTGWVNFAYSEGSDTEIFRGYKTKVSIKFESNKIEVLTSDPTEAPFGKEPTKDTDIEKGFSVSSVGFRWRECS